MATAFIQPEVALFTGALDRAIAWRPQGAGAVVLFEGVVRPTEGGQLLAALGYESYEPMTTRGLSELGAAMIREHGLTALRVEHSVGRVPIHAVSFRLYIASAHRKEALRAMDTFIDRMKREVPLWKVPHWEPSDG